MYVCMYLYIYCSIAIIGTRVGGCVLTCKGKVIQKYPPIFALHTGYLYMCVCMYIPAAEHNLTKTTFLNKLQLFLYACVSVYVSHYLGLLIIAIIAIIFIYASSYYYYYLLIKQIY